MDTCMDLYDRYTDIPHRVCNDPQFLEDFHFINQVEEASEAGKTAESIFKRLKAAEFNPLVGLEVHIFFLAPIWI